MNDFMICSECKSLGLKSNVYVGYSVSTCIAGSAYYDENGNYHWHDPNTISTEYICSNGHKWSEISQVGCPTCKYESG